MRVTRVYTGSDGETHFEEVKVSLGPGPRGLFKRSESLKASGMSYCVFEGPLYEDWHTASRKQCIIILSGEVELGVGSGEKRRFGPGDVLLMEDTTGKGHTTYSVDDMRREEVWVALE